MAEELELEPQGRLRSYAQATFVAATLAAQQGSLGKEHKISTPEAILLGIYALALDLSALVGANSIPIADILALPFDLYIFLKGLPLGRMVTNQVIELIPAVDEVYPGYVVGWVLTVWLDRHPQVARAVNIASGVKSLGGKGVAAARQLRGKAPGIVRSIPGEASTGLQPRMGVQKIVTKVEKGEGGEIIKHTQFKDQSKSWAGRQREKIQEKTAKQQEKGGSTEGVDTVEFRPEAGELYPGEQTLFETPAFQEPSAVKPYRIVDERASTSVPDSNAVVEERQKKREEEGGAKTPARRYREEYVAASEMPDAVTAKRGASYSTDTSIPSYERTATTPETQTEVPQKTPMQRPVESISSPVTPTTQPQPQPEPRIIYEQPRAETVATPTIPATPSPTPTPIPAPAPVSTSMPVSVPITPVEPIVVPSVVLPKQSQIVELPEEILDSAPYRPARPWQRRKRVIPQPEPVTAPEPRELTDYEKALFENVVVEAMPEQTSTPPTPRRVPPPPQKKEKEAEEKRRHPDVHPKLRVVGGTSRPMAPPSPPPPPPPQAPEKPDTTSLPKAA